MSDTRRQILETARQLFNADGLQRVGVRDVARAAGISVGNLSYHFPTRDDLVAALVEELAARGDELIFGAVPPDFSLVTLYRAAVAVMRSMLDYRFVLLSFVDAVRSSPRLFALERDLAARRRRSHDAMLDVLVANGFLEPATKRRSETLFEQSSFISSGWLAAATLRGWSDERAVLHFAKLGMALLEPHTTPKGTRQMRQIFDGQHDRSR